MGQGPAKSRRDGVSTKMADVHLPTDEDQEWLLDQLSALIERQGAATFLNAPILEPTEEHSPDHWTFVGIDGNTCRFGAAKHNLGDPESIVGVMCHEVAHAYRAFHDLNEPDSTLEEELTDLTTVYLGFGLITTNSSLLYRTSGDLWSTSYSLKASGYLSPPTMSFLLAIQALCRGMSSSRIRHISGALERTQKACFRASIKAKGGVAGGEELLSKLGIGEADRVRGSDATPAADVGELDDEDDDEQGEDEEEELFNLGKNTFRVRRSRAVRYALVGGFGGFIVGTIAVAVGAPGFALPGCPLVFALLGAAMGVGIRVDYCSAAIDVALERADRLDVATEIE